MRPRSTALPWLNSMVPRHWALYGIHAATIVQPRLVVRRITCALGTFLIALHAQYECVMMMSLFGRPGNAPSLGCVKGAGDSR